MYTSILLQHRESQRNNPQYSIVNGRKKREKKKKNEIKLKQNSKMISIVRKGNDRNDKK